MIAAAATKGDVTIRNVIPKHLESLSAKLIEMGAQVEENGDWIRVKGPEEILKVNIKTLPYPGFLRICILLRRFCFVWRRVPVQLLKEYGIPGSSMLMN